MCVQSGRDSMDQVSVTAASGLQSRMEALDLVANNLANTTTGGFKLDREFYSLFTAADNEADGGSTRLPLIQKQWTDFSQGVLTPTGNALDLALSGKGFFAVNGPNGPLYTRNGSFQLSPSGQLTTADGYAVRDTRRASRFNRNRRLLLKWARTAPSRRAESNAGPIADCGFCGSFDAAEVGKQLLHA